MEENVAEKLDCVCLRETLKLYGGDGSRMEPIIPVLIDARLISMHGDKMLFRGVEEGVDGVQFAQEWSVKVSG